jgi:hypothetical protein
MMNRKWMISGAAWLLLLTGCQKSTNNPTDTTSNGQDANAANQAGGQAGSDQQASGRAQRPAPGPIVVPEGTTISVILTNTLNSRVNKPGDQFEGSVAAPVMVEGEVAIPRDARVTGTVVDAKKQGTFKGAATMAVQLTGVRVRGQDYEIATNTYAGTEKGKGKRTAVVTGGGAALGALIGGLAGGGKGAAIGAAAGGGGGLAASGATGGKNVEFPAESRLTFKLSRSVTIER